MTEKRITKNITNRPVTAKSKTGLPLTMMLTPGADLEAYMRTINNIPILSDQEESLLAERLYQHQDVEAARLLVLSHLRFVVHIARSYMGYGLPLADLIQEGNLGLMKAVKRFDPRVGVRLVSFAVHWIKAEIHEFVLKNWRIVKIATTKAQRKLFFNLRSAKKSLHWLTDKEAVDIATTLNVSSKTVKEMENRLSMQDEVFDRPETEQENGIHEYHIPANYLSGDHDNPELLVEQEYAENLSHRRLSLAMKSLDARSKAILVQRWLSEKKATLHELAEQFKVSPERIRQIEASAMKKLQHHIVAAERRISG